MPNSSSPTILYITGMMRCGSTIIGNILNELEGVTHLGERYFLYKNAMLRDGTNTSCGCGADLLECPVWSHVLDAVGTRDHGRAAALWAAQQAHMRTRHSLPRVLGLRPRGNNAASLDDVTMATTDVYRAVANFCHADVVVDSSKVPAEAAVLARDAGLDVRVLHVVRDPRATVASYATPKEYLEKLSLPRATLYWAGFNAASDAVGGTLGRDRFMRVRYEDFTRSPRSTIMSIAAFAGCRQAVTEAAFESESSLHLHGNHTVTGNPDRLKKGRVDINHRDQWRSTMPNLARLAVSVGTGAQMLGYGYGRP